MRQLKEAGIDFVVRLNVGLHPRFTRRDEKEVTLSLAPGKQAFWWGLRYKGEVEVNVGGVWEKGMPKPLWVITDLDPKEALSIYRQRMKIEESFRDLKGLLGLERLMNKAREYMEGVVALVLMAYAIALLLGEEVRDRVFGSSKRRCLYSGPFVLLNLRVKLSWEEVREILARVLSSFPSPIPPPVSTHV